MTGPPSPERLRLWTLVAWGLPTVAYAFPFFFLSTYFLKFATDVLLLAPATVGLLFGAGRVWDAISDPLAGYLSDRTRSRWGRRRPWMAASIPFVALFFVMLWSPPESLSQGALVAWSGVALFGFYTAYTTYVIPHYSLGTELSLDHHERSRVFGVRHAAFTIGVVLSFAALQLVENAPDRREAARDLALGVALGICALLTLAPVSVRERAEHQGRGGESALAAVRDVLRNPHARLLYTVTFIEALGGGVLGVLAPFIAEYVLRRPDVVAMIPAFYVAFSVASIPVWLALSRRFGKKPVWIGAMLATSLVFGATIFAGEGDVALLCGLMALAGIAAGCGGAVGNSLIADVIDWDELASGQRKEGAYVAAAGFALKAAVGLTVMMVGLALQASGFRPNVAQAPAALWTIKGLFAGGPFLGYMIGALLFRRFRLDQAEHERVRRELDARALGRS